MNKTWKWILGIVAAVILVGAMFAIGYAWRSQMAPGWDEARYPDRAWNHPMARNDWNERMPRGDWNHPMMNAPYASHNMYMPFGGFFFFGGLVKFALFIGMLYGAYWLGRRNARISLDPSTDSGQRLQPAARVDASAAPEAESAAPSREADSPPAPRKRARKSE